MIDALVLPLVMVFLSPASIAASEVPSATPISQPASEQLVGKVRPTDGDSLRMGDKRIRLFGIDAVESAQTCQLDGELWKCGRASKRALEGLTVGKTVTCEVRDMDRTRYVSVCWADGQDINAAMVRQGFAVAYTRYSLDYTGEELDARSEQRGLWNPRIAFQRPHDWRADQRADQARRIAAEPDVPPNALCNLKGNISRSGNKIVHAPGQRDYARTRISEDRGERWFCSLEEARTAGWRQASR